MGRDASEAYYFGEWWLPPTSGNRAKGTLTVSAGRGVTLLLEPGASLGPIPAAGIPVFEAFSIQLHVTHPVILGEAHEIVSGKLQQQTLCLTLGTCYVEPETSSLPGCVSYAIGLATVGEMHVPSLCFDELCFDVPDLANAFPGESIFGHWRGQGPVSTSTGKPVFATHQVVQRWFVQSGLSARWSMRPDTEIRFVHDIETNRHVPGATSLTEEYRMILRFRFRKERWTIDNALWFWDDFSQFFWIMTGLRPRFTHIAGRAHDSSRTMSLDIYAFRSSDGSPFLSDASSDPGANRRALFNVSELASRDIGSFWLKWFWAKLGLSEVVLLRGIGRQLFERRCYDEALLLFVAALESLHRVWTPDVEPGEGARNKNPKAGNQALPAYINRLAQQYMPELRTYAADLSLAVSDCRNYAAHRGVEATKNRGRWPSSLLEAVPWFCEFLVDITILDFVESHRRSRARLARKYAAHPEHARLVHYIATELDKRPSKPSATG